MLALFNWRQRIQATGLGQIWKCQPTSVKTPLFVSQSGQKKKEKEKETGMFSYSGQGNTPLTGWFTMSPTLRTKTSLWSGNYRLSLLTLLSLSLSLCVSLAHSPSFLPVLMFWLQIEGDKPYKNLFSMTLDCEKRRKCIWLPPLYGSRTMWDEADLCR